jgi:hypothetical protein
MRIFIGFKYRTIGSNPQELYVPVMYGDLTRQVANLIKENSENKMPSVPRIACYIDDVELDTSRLSDATFVNKISVRERDYDVVNGEKVFKNSQGGTYTVERLMPTPYKLTMKADIWTSNTDQKLQLFEQISVLFTPSLDIQTTDNYLDWTSLSTVYLSSVNFTGRTIPTGTESEIDVMTMTFETPIWISPPVKVKKLGIVKTVINNIFTEQGDIVDLNDLVYDGNSNVQIRRTYDGYGVLLLKNPVTGFYDCSVLNPTEAVNSLKLEIPIKGGSRLDWNAVLALYGNYSGTSRIFFQQPNGYEISGTFTVNEIDPTYLVVDLDIDTLPTNTEPAIDAIINPYTFNPIKKFGTLSNIPSGTRYLMLDNVNNSINVGGLVNIPGDDSARSPYDGPDGWKNLDGSDPVIKANSIIEWNGNAWVESFSPEETEIRYVSNLTTGIQYKWENGEWLKSFEGEYAAGYWRFQLDS